MSRKMVVVELAAAGLACMLLAFTIARPPWIELLFRTDPDHGSGLFEILLVGGLTTVGAGASLAVRRQRRRPGSVAESVSCEDARTYSDSSLPHS
jgi:hypothetical protein